MSSFWAVYLREMIILRRRLKRQISGVAVAPLLYMLTFGYALGGRLDMGSHSYMEFLLPGLAAMSSMTQAFSIASEINIARFYSAVFEEIQASPTSRAAYVSGEVCAGLTRVALGCAVILLLGWCFGIRLRYGADFWAAILLNGFVFSSLAVCLAMLVKSHADQALLNTFVITPMAFLGGTFFAVEQLPQWAGRLLWFLPLTHASRAARGAAFGMGADSASYAILFAAGCICFCLALLTVSKARD